MSIIGIAIHMLLMIILGIGLAALASIAIAAQVRGMNFMFSDKNVLVRILATSIVALTLVSIVRSVFPGIVVLALLGAYPLYAISVSTISAFVAVVVIIVFFIKVR